MSKRRLVLNLNPFLNDMSVLCVNGRLANAPIPEEERKPIIIPEKSRLCDLLIQFTHKILVHSEHLLMVRAIRQRYFIRNLRNKIKHCKRHCKACTVYKHRARTQIMSAFSPERVTMAPAFALTGVDFAGPFQLKTSTVRSAHYIKGSASLPTAMVQRVGARRQCERSRVRILVLA